MKTVKEHTVETTEITRSKFIAHLVPIAEYDGLQEKLKREHPKANHVVYALRYLNEYDQVVENSSDDGEPKGCAGVPALNVLRGEEMINCAVLIVRYFGGIKLGTGGMARAYASSVKNVLNMAEVILYEKEISYSFFTSYSEADKTLHTLKQIGITIFERDFGVDGIHWKVFTTQEKLKVLKSTER